MPTHVGQSFMSITTGSYSGSATEYNNSYPFPLFHVMTSLMTLNKSLLFLYSDTVGVFCTLLFC